MFTFKNEAPERGISEYERREVFKAVREKAENQLPCGGELNRELQREAFTIQTRQPTPNLPVCRERTVMLKHT